MSEMPVSPFAAILSGEEPGKIISRDDEKRFALIESLHPEAQVHWLAVPFEDGYSTEEMAQMDRERFLDLVDFAVSQARALSPHYPDIERGFTIKFHFGTFETVKHAKLHILSTE